MYRYGNTLINCCCCCWFKTIDLAPRPSEICEDCDAERRNPPKIEPAACNVIYDHMPLGNLFNPLL